MTQQDKTTWKLPQLLTELGLTPYAVEKEASRLGYTLGMNTMYRLAKDGGPNRIDRMSLTAIIEALRSLSGRSVSIGDVLGFQDDLG